MPLVCTQIEEWIEEEVSKPVEEWVEKTENVCKDWPWPLDWICKAVTTLVQVITWVIVKVGKWVAREVCVVVAAVVNFIVDFATGLWDVIAGIFTLDWRRILDGLIEIGSSIVVVVFTLLGVLLLGDTIEYIKEEIENYELRKYVRGLLEKKYSDDQLQNIKDALHLDHGAFGYRITMSSVRTYLDAETKLDGQDAPNLVILNENGDINLRELCGFEFNEGYWNRKRYKTLKKGLIATGGGGGEVTNPISEDELSSYLSTRGAENAKFIVLAMTDGALDTKLHAAEDKGRQLGLMISWKKSETEVMQKKHIVHDGFDTTSADSSLVSFLSSVIMRTGSDDELCNPVAVSVFRYTDTLRGLTACLKGSKCQDMHKVSGLTYIDNRPDVIWRYVAMHEMGHYFGLCHVDGVDRIMYSPRQNSWWSWTVLLNLLYLNHEPKFILDEAKQAWDYIVLNFPAKCLGG